MIRFILFVAVAGSCLCAATNNSKARAALVVTLAGDHKLTEYFEWSCRTIGASSSLFDMLIFHEANVKLQNVTCADNVKLIAWGVYGMSRHIVQSISIDSNPAELTRNELLM